MNGPSGPSESGRFPEKEKVRFLFPFIGGLILTLSFPETDLYPLAPLALVPLLEASRGNGFLRALGGGLLFGLTHFTTLLYWLPEVMTRFGGFSWPAAVGLHLLLCLYLGLYPALAVALTEKAGALKNPSLFGGLVFGTLWVIFEFLRGLGPLGFPWEPLGAVLAPNPYLIQPASFAGVYGLSFLVAFSGYALWGILGHGRRAQRLILCASTLWLLNALIGWYLISKGPSPMPMKVCLVQGNVSQNIKWSPGQERKNLEKYLALSRKLIPERPDLIVWPETAMTFVFPVDPLVKNLFSGIRTLGIPVLLGIPRVEVRSDGYVMKNSMVLVSSSGKVLGIYDKEHLVPFGEYIPFEQWLPWLRHFAVAAGNYVPGQESGVLRISGHRLGILICFENVFPGLSRKRVRAGADLLIVATNDAWFGRSAALAQHFYQSVLRAVETRRYVIQVGNTGLSGLIDPSGRVLTLGPINREWTACFGPQSQPKSPARRSGS